MSQDDGKFTILLPSYNFPLSYENEYKHKIFKGLLTAQRPLGLLPVISTVVNKQLCQISLPRPHTGVYSYAGDSYLPFIKCLALS